MPFRLVVPRSGQDGVDCSVNPLTALSLACNRRRRFSPALELVRPVGSGSSSSRKPERSMAISLSSFFSRISFRSRSDAKHGPEST